MLNENGRKSIHDRHSIVLTAVARESLSIIAKQYKITQGEVVEAFLDNMEPAVMAPIFGKIRDDKVAARTPKRDLMAKLRNLTPEQLIALENMTGGQ